MKCPEVARGSRLLKAINFDVLEGELPVLWVNESIMSSPRCPSPEGSSFHCPKRARFPKD
jgi:hypothetical protein